MFKQCLPDVCAGSAFCVNIMETSFESFMDLLLIEVFCYGGVALVLKILQELQQQNETGYAELIANVLYIKHL